MTEMTKDIQHIKVRLAKDDISQPASSSPQTPLPKNETTIDEDMASELRKIRRMIEEHIQYKF